MKPTAQTAISALDNVRQMLGPQYVAYWILPNSILSLSGARPYSDGVFWDDENKGLLQTWEKDLLASAEVIMDYVPTLWSDVKIEEVRPNETYTGYEMLYKPGLEFVLSQTELLPDVSVEKMMETKTQAETFGLVTQALKAQPRFSQFSDDKLSHTAFGIMLGYPDKAILGAVDFWDKTDPFDEPLVGADIRGADYYVSPQPVYDYPRHLITDSDIIAHEKLWSDILREFYTSDFHTTIAADSAFMDKMHELGNIS